MKTRENWLERLGKWEEALIISNNQLRENPADYTILCSCIRCYSALGNYQKVIDITEELSPNIISSKLIEELSINMIEACWINSDFTKLSKYVEYLEEGSLNRTYYEIVINIQNNNFNEAKELITKSRKSLNATLPVLVQESYYRSYTPLLLVEEISDLEEVIEIKSGMLQPQQYVERLERVKKTWYVKLIANHSHIEPWNRFLCIFTLLFDIPVRIRISSRI